MQPTREILKIPYVDNQLIEISYYKWGNGKSLFFIPGAGASTHYYQKALDELSKHFTIIAFNYPGFDKTPLLKIPRTIELYTHLFTSAILQFGLKENIVLAHSMGCGLTLQIDATQPGLLNKACLLAPLLETYSGSPISLAIRVYRSYSRASNVAGNVMENPLQIVKEHLRDIPEMINQLLLVSKDFSPKLQKASHAKKLLIHGDSDELFSKERQLALSRTIPRSTFLLEDGGHDILFTKNESITHKITEFLYNTV